MIAEITSTRNHRELRIVPAPPHLKKDGDGAYLFDPNRIRVNPSQPRKRFRKIPSLARSISTIGHLNPGIVRFVDDDPNIDAELVDGERRWRACRHANDYMNGDKDGNPIFYRAFPKTDIANTSELRMKAFAANFGKEDHDVIEIAESIRDMLTDGYSREQIREITGKSITWVYQHESLLKLHPDVQALLIPAEDGDDEDKEARGTLSFSTALLLVDLPHEQQQQRAKEIMTGRLGLTAARRHVYQKARASGIKLRVRSHRPTQRFASLLNLSSEMKDKVGIFLDMTNAEMDTMLEAIGPESKDLLLARVEEFSEELTTLLEILRKKIKVGKTASKPPA